MILFQSILTKKPEYGKVSQLSIGKPKGRRKKFFS